jgi:hypothetical protein
MVRIVFSTIIALHGIVHLIGFSKEWNLGPTGRRFSKTLIPFSENGSKVAGLLWLTACALMIAASYLYFQKKEWYWIPSLIGLVISQILIVLYWHDAKYGTIANIILVCVTILGAGFMNYNKLVRSEIKSIIARPTEQRIITNEDVVTMPAPVQRWLLRSGVIGSRVPQYVHVTQQGMMRTKADAGWMPFTAEQYFTIEEPAFVWNATIRSSFLPIVGRDKFINGHGNMLIKPLYIYELANSTGPEIDQGTLLRYLAEMTWFPQAAVSRYLVWEEIDDTHARVTMNYKGLSATGTFTIDHNGDAVGFEAMRFGEFNGEYRKEPWSIATTDHRMFNGIRSGSKSEVTWKLKDGHFLWLKLEILNISFVNESRNEKQ